MFKDGQTIVHHEDRSSRPSVVTDLLQSERRRFTISELSHEFPQISRTLLYEIITVRLCYHKFWARWAPNMLMGVHKMQRMALVLIFLEQYHKGGSEFLNHTVLVPGDDTCVSFVNVETKKQSKLWMHTP
jgi:hypothetical protein